MFVARDGAKHFLGAGQVRFMASAGVPKKD
jgi:hypothetical protein